MTFEDLLREAEPALQRFVRFQIGSRQDAEDVLQETCPPCATSAGSDADKIGSCQTCCILLK